MKEGKDTALSVKKQDANDQRLKRMCSVQGIKNGLVRCIRQENEIGEKSKLHSDQSFIYHR